MIKIKIILLILSVIYLGYWLVIKSKGKKIMELNYIVTETKGPDSFDPVNADSTQNITVMRMLFATPLEVDRSNKLSSKILKSFEYKRETHEILFEVRDDQRYSDGTELTSEDVALAIARMAYYRPQFPVIKEIDGLKEWIDSKKGLLTFPSGIKVVGRKVIVRFSRDISNPLFRFCLELFSVVPAKCINKETTKMVCDLPPSSGYFELSSYSSEAFIFKRRAEQNTVDPLVFETIRFNFKKLSEVCKEKLASNEIISGVELDYLSTNCGNYLLSQQVHWLPSARFGVVRFNPNKGPFKVKEGRQLFSETVRMILNSKNKNLIVERGLFSRLIPGYIENENFSFVFEQSTYDIFKGANIILPKIENSGLKIVFDAIVEAAQKLQMDVHLIEEPTYESLVTDFLNGKVPVIAGASGFWAQDPIGDVSMWFTPNLHKTMSFLWSDKKIYEQIASLELEVDPFEIQKKMNEFNKYIVDQSVVAPVVHFRRLYITSKPITKLNLPQAVTSPAPWHLVPEQE